MVGGFTISSDYIRKLNDISTKLGYINAIDWIKDQIDKQYQQHFKEQTQTTSLQQPFHIDYKSHDIMNKLTAAANNVDLSMLGMCVVEKNIFDKYKDIFRILIAQAKMDNIVDSETQLLIRPIIPHLDLLYGNGCTIEKDKGWINGYNPTYKHNDNFIAYKTGRSCDNDRKCYMFCGIKLHRFIAPNPPETIMFWHTDVKLITQIDTKDIISYYEMAAPIIARKGDDIWILHKDTGLNNNVEYIGFVAESVGQRMCY